MPLILAPSEYKRWLSDDLIHATCCSHFQPNRCTCGQFRRGSTSRKTTTRRSWRKWNYLLSNRSHARRRRVSQKSRLIHINDPLRPTSHYSIGAGGGFSACSNVCLGPNRLWLLDFFLRLPH